MGTKSLFGGLFDELFSPSTWSVTTTTAAPVESHPVGPYSHDAANKYRTRDNDGVLCLEVDLPGIDPKTVTLSSLNSVITVQGVRGHSNFVHRYTISADYDVDSAMASMAHGQLTIKLKKFEGGKPKPIKIDIT